MSKGRMILRVVLVLMVLGLGWIGYMLWAKGRPEYYWSRAQGALAREEYETARLHLQSLLQKHPEHAEGHKALADVLVREAAVTNERASYAGVPVALEHLAEAARLRPDDAELQLELLGAYLRQRRLGLAAEVSERLLEVEPENPDVLFPLAWRAVERKQVRTAEDLIARLANVQSARVFQTLALQAKLYQEAGNGEKVSESYATAERLARDLTTEQLGYLHGSDRETLLQLLLQHVGQAADAGAAQRRLESAVIACEKLAQGELLEQEPAEAACLGLFAVHQKFPDTAFPENLRAQRRDLLARAGELAQGAIAAESIAPVVYLVAAEAAFQKGGDDEGISLLRRGIEATAALSPEQRLDLHMAAARRLVALGRYGEAEPHVAELVAEEKSAGWGNLLAGAIAANEGRLEKAKGHFQLARQKLGNILVVRSALASIHLEQQEWKEAVSLLETLHVDFSQFEEEQRRWAERYLGSEAKVHFDELRARLALDQWGESQRHLEAIKGTEYEPRGWQLASAYLFAKGRKGQALGLLEDARRKFPEDTQLLAQQAHVLQQEGDAAAALAAVEEFAAAAPEDFPRRLLLVRWRLAEKDFPAALRELESLEPLAAGEGERRVVTLLKAHALTALDRGEEAIALLEPLGDDPAAAAASHVLRAAAHLAEEDLPSAIKSMVEAAETNPRSGTLGILHGRAAELQGDFGKALDVLAPALDVTRVRARAHGQVLALLHKLAAAEGLPAAERKVEELLARHPDDFVLLVARADFHFRQGRFEPGMALLDQAERRHPENPAVYLFRGRARLLRGDWENVRREAEKALALQPENPAALLLAGQAALAREQFGEALTRAREARRLQPEWWEAHALEAQGLIQLKRHEEAGRLIMEYQRRHVEETAPRVLLAHVWETAGRPEEARRVFQEAREARPEEPYWGVAEAALLIRLNRNEEGAALAEELFGAGEAAAPVYSVAHAFASAGDLARAEAWAQRAFARAKPEEQAAVHLLLGKLALRAAGENPAERGRLVEAKNHFEAVLREHPRHLVAANNLGWLLATEFNQPEEAIRIVEGVREGLDSAALPSEFVDTLGEVYRRAGRAAEVEPLLGSLVGARQDDANLLYQFGMALYELNRREAARNALTKADRLGLAPDRAGHVQRVLAEFEN